MLKKANLCLRSSVQQLATENTALKKELSDIAAINKQLAENAEELEKLREDRKRWEDGIKKIRSAFQTLEALAKFDNGGTEDQMAG
jgi:predicted  nucleic acid-binding Zn-ribbon protein